MSGAHDHQHSAPQVSPAQHHHGHEHGHDHGSCHADHHHGAHGHHHVPTDFGRVFAIGIALNLLFVVIETLIGWRASSLALLADAAHNLSDVAGLILAWSAIVVAKRTPTRRFTYGWQRGSIIASFINAVILLFAMGSLAWEAILRLQQPEPFDAMPVMVVAAIGVGVNGFTAWLFIKGSREDLNIRGAFLHMLSDALVSVGVIVAAALYVWLGWVWIDPLVSLVIALVIGWGTWSLFKQSLQLMFDGVPAHIDMDEITQVLTGIAGVNTVHDVHVWAMGTSKVALTAHLVLRDNTSSQDEVLRLALEAMDTKFGIKHATLQIESQSYSGNCHDCAVGLL